MGAEVPPGVRGYWFGEALGELLTGVGLRVANFAASYGLDVDNDLARVLPDPENG